MIGRISATLLLCVLGAASLAASPVTANAARPRHHQHQHYAASDAGRKLGDVAATTTATAAAGHAGKGSGGGGYGGGLAALDRARAALQSMLSLIYHRYEMHTSYGADLFRVYHNLGNATWTALRTKFARQIVLAHVHRRDSGTSTSASAASKYGPASFIYVFGGSSVTSGHDNYYNQSYPSVFDRRMRPAFEALGIELRVRNIAMGGAGCDPYNACYGPQADDNPDFVSWEQSYFCKRSPSMEALVRYAASSSAHAVMMFQASGSSVPRHCNASEPGAVPYNSEDWSPYSDVSPPLKPWAPGIAEVRRERDLLFEYNAAAATGSGFYNWLAPYHPLVKPCGLESWSSNGRASDKQLASHDAVMSSCKLKFATKEIGVFGQPGGFGAKHHPTASSHLLRAEAIAWVHGLVLLDAIDLVRSDLEAVSASSTSTASGAATSAVSSAAKSSKAHYLAEKYHRHVKELFAAPMPAPSTCNSALHCDEPVLRCYNDYQPHFNPGLHLHSLRVGSTDWTYVNETAAPSHRWNVCQYQDFKQFFSSAQASGELHLRVNVSEASRAVQFCGTLKNAAFFLTPNVPPSSPFTSTAAATGRKPWLSVSQPLCTELSGLPPGSHVVSIRKNVTSGDDVTVTHVLMWA